MQIIATKITDRIPDSLFKRLRECMSPEKQERCMRFRRIEDSERLLAGDILVRYYLCAEFGYRNHELQFDAGEYQKPFLVNAPEIRFNVSHSGQWAVAAFDERDVGVDIQKIKPVHMDIARRYFTPGEYQTLLQKADKDRIPLFYTLWTLKESCMKAVGKGLSLGLDTFSFAIESGRIICKTGPEYNRFQFQTPEIDPEYKLAVCYSEKSAFETMTRIDPDQIDVSGVLYA